MPLGPSVEQRARHMETFADLNKNTQKNVPCDATISCVGTGRKEGSGQLGFTRQEKAATRRRYGEWVCGLGTWANTVCPAGFGPLEPTEAECGQKRPAAHRWTYPFVTQRCLKWLFVQQSWVRSPGLPVRDGHGGGGHMCQKIGSGCGCRSSGMMSMCGKDLNMLQA